MRSRLQPEIKSPRSIDIPSVDILEARNGVKLHKIASSDEEVMRVSFVFRAGSSMQSVPYSASTAANLLSEGSERMTSQEIAEKLDYYGSYFDVTMDRDYVVITFCSLHKFFDQTMEVARELLLHPIFPQNELETYVAKRKQRLLVERSKAAFQARELFTESLFGKYHPYGVSQPTEMYDNLTREDIVAVYNRLYCAENCFVVCSGNIDDHISDSLLSLCGDIPTSVEGVVYPDFPEAESKVSSFKEFPNGVQSAIRIGRRLFTRSHPDFVPMQVLSTVLGGYFGSRLVRNLREERGYTYGVFSVVANMECDGYLAIATEVAVEATNDSLDQIFYEIERLQRELVPVEELDMVRNIMIGEMMRILDAPFGIADFTIENISNQSDNSYLNSMIAQILAVTPSELHALAVKYFDRDTFTTVVVHPAGLEETSINVCKTSQTL